MSGEGSPRPARIQEEDSVSSESPFQHVAARVQAEDSHPKIHGLRDCAHRVMLLYNLWKRLLGLAPCATVADVSDDAPTRPPLMKRLCGAALMLVLLTALLFTIGLQWARCQLVYMDRVRPVNHSGHFVINATNIEYMCRFSFVWTHLMPSLLHALGYIVIFVCWFCLRNSEFSNAVKRAYDSALDHSQYDGVDNTFCKNTNWDFWTIFVAVPVVSVAILINTVFGDGIFTELLHPVTKACPVWISVLSEVFNFISDAVIVNVIICALLGYLLSLKYMELILVKTQTHLENINTNELAHISVHNYIKLQYTSGHGAVKQAQAAVSTAFLMLVMRVGKAVAVAVLDNVRWGPRPESAAPLPLLIIYLGLAFYVLRRCAQLTYCGLVAHVRFVSTGPNFATGGAPSDAEYGGPSSSVEQPSSTQGEESARPASPPAESGAGPEEPAAPAPAPAPQQRRLSSPPPPLPITAARSPEQWRNALEICPAITGQLFGRNVHTSLTFLLFIAACVLYGIVFALLELYVPLV